MSLESSFRKPVPYETDLIGHGLVVKDTSRVFIVKAEIMDLNGIVLANGEVRYLRLPVAKIAENASVHDEMPYLIPDNVTDLL